MARFTTFFITVSEANRKEAIALGLGNPSQYRTIRSGISLDAYRAIVHHPNVTVGMSLKPHHKLVTTIGPFKPQKNLQDFIRMARLVYDHFPDARFAIAGDGVLRPRLEKLIHQQALDNVLFLVGWQRDIPSLLMRTNIFVLTSWWEGLPRALLEAMAAARPCVVNDVDGTRDVIEEGKTGYLISPKRPDLSAERVIQLLERPSEAQQMGQRARQALGSEFDIDRMVRQQEDLYQELCHNRKGI